MKPYLIDIPVLLIFMARPKQFALVFEQVKNARPSKLFLYQDGPRKERKDDVENIAKCREIAENIDWECEVHKMYQEKNVGCDPSEYIAQKWMFSYVDRGIILEDDDVPSQSFFPFCKEMLEYYYNDLRISIICGMNHLGKYENINNDSYFFTTSGSIWGWATWKRTIDLWDEKLSFLNDIHILKLLEKILGKKFYKYRISGIKRNKESGRAHYESILGSTVILNSQLNIVPVKNLISNIGIASDSTHAVDSIKKLPKGIRSIFFMKTYNLEFPLRHPKYIVNDLIYQEKVNRILGGVNPFISFKRRMEVKFYKFIFAIKRIFGLNHE